MPPEKRSFSKNRQLAVSAGKKGGEAVPAAERSFSQNRELAVAAGKKGGEARASLVCTEDPAPPHDEDEKKE